MINPTRLVWRDSNPYPVDFEVGHNTGQGFEPLLIVVGTLRDDQFYEAPIAEMPFGEGSHEVAMRCIDRSRETNNVSAWSQPVSFEIRGVVAAPFDLAVE